MVDQSKTADDATVVMAAVPVEDATVLLEPTPSSPIQAVPAPAAAPATVWPSATQSGSMAGAATISAGAAASSPPPRPLWLAVLLGVGCGLALFAATVLLWPRG